jgi:hypothetical protein
MTIIQSKSYLTFNLKIKRRGLLKKPGSCLSGFKKRLFNHILIRDGSLLPAWNRRKHRITYGLTFDHPLQMLSKAFGNLGITDLKWPIGASLKTTYALTNVNTAEVHMANIKAKTACSRLADAIETHTCVLLYRNLHAVSPPNARQALNHRPKSKSPFLYALTYALGERHDHLAKAQSFIWVKPGESIRLY